MRRTCIALLTAALALATSAAAPPPRIVAIGDVHGAADAFTAILQKTGLIDAGRRWTGGNAVLVQTGDLLDRGADIRQILDLLMALEPQAAAAGGRIHALMGNHEAMNLIGEMQDVSADVFQRFADDRSESRREQAFQAASKLSRDVPIDKPAWLAAHPLGYVEYREAFKASAPYGKWLRSKPIIAEIDDTVFMHGGINLTFTSDSLDNINRRVRRELNEFDEGFRWLQTHERALPFSTLKEVFQAAQTEVLRLEAKRKREPLEDEDVTAAKALLPIVAIDSSALLNPNGPLWFRGYSAWTQEEGTGQMAALLKKYKVTRFVTGHTPQPSGRITSRFGGALYLIDTGMLNGKFYPMGRPSALEIVGEKVAEIYLDR